MWSHVFESFAEVFGVTRRVRPAVFALVAGLGVLLCALSFAEGGPRGIVALLVILFLGITASTQVLRARRALWRAARLGLEDPAQRPRLTGEERDMPPTTRALWQLARAVDEARRGAALEAAHHLDGLDRELLRDEERRLFDATRALIALMMGDADRAAALARRALPTGCDEIDVMLGRALVTSAWSDAERLRAIDEEWAASGVESDARQPLPRLRSILRLRIEAGAVEALESWEAKALADEARAIGDEALAADLEARVRPTAYR